MVKKITILLTVASIISLQTMKSAYVYTPGQPTPKTTPIVVGNGRYPMQRPSGLNVSPAEQEMHTVNKTTPTAPLRMAPASKHEAIVTAVQQLDDALKKKGVNVNFKVSCFAGTQHGPVGPHDVVIAQWPNPNYTKHLMGAGKYCYLTYTPEMSILEGTARADEEGHLPVIPTEE